VCKTYIWQKQQQRIKLTTNNRAKARSLGSNCAYLTSASNRLEANADESEVSSFPDASAATAKYLAVGSTVFLLDLSRFLDRSSSAAAGLSFLFAMDELNRQLLCRRYCF
jgi:hypothetical protein